MAQTLEQQFVEYVELTRAAMDKAARELESRATAEKTASEAAGPLIGEAIAALRESGLLPGHRKEAAERAFATHEGTLKVLCRLGKLAVPRKLAEAPEPIGAPAPPPTKQAAAGSSPSADQVLSERLLAFRRY